MIPSVAFQPHGSCDLTALAGGFAGDHGMNQRFGPLTCVLSMAMLAALSSDASAHARHKETQPAKKAETKAEASGKAGHHREAVHKEDVARKHKKDVARKKDKDKHAA